MANHTTSRREIVLINKSEPRDTDRWNTIERISKVLSIAAIPIVLAAGSWIIQGSLQDHTVSRDYVQLAVSILREPDKTKVTPQIRDWAVDLLNNNSTIKFSAQVAQQLKSGETTLPTTMGELLKTAINGGSIAVSPDGKIFAVATREKSELNGWKSPYQSEADAVDQAHRLADGYNRQFLRVLRQLRDLRRYTPVVIHNAQHVNVGNQQLNVSTRT